MGSETVLALDRKQSGPDARRCPRGPGYDLASNEFIEGDHGRLMPDGSGTMLICGTCGYSEPAAALAESQQ